MEHLEEDRKTRKMTYKELLFKMAEKDMLTLSSDKDGRGLFWAGMNNMNALEKEFPPYPFAKENFNKPNASAWREYQAKNMGYDSWKKCTANESLKKRQRHWDGFLSMGVEMWTKDPPPND